MFREFSRCGCAQGPLDIPESVAQASSAAAVRRRSVMTGGRGVWRLIEVEIEATDFCNMEIEIKD